MAGDCGGGGHGGADQVGATAGALSAFEVAVARGGAALAGREDVGVHAQAHRATGVAPVEARVAEAVGDDAQTDQLSGFAMDAWIGFARTGNPSTNALPGCPEYRATQRYTMVFGPDVKTAPRRPRGRALDLEQSDLLE